MQKNALNSCVFKKKAVILQSICNVYVTNHE